MPERQWLPGCEKSGLKSNNDFSLCQGEMRGKTLSEKLSMIQRKHSSSFDNCETSSLFADILSKILVDCFGLLLLSLGVISGFLGGMIGTLTGVSISGYYLGSIGRSVLCRISFNSGDHPSRGFDWSQDRIEPVEQRGRRCLGAIGGPHRWVEKRKAHVRPVVTIFFFEGGYFGTSVTMYYVTSHLGILFGLFAGGICGAAVGAVTSLFFAVISTVWSLSDLSGPVSRQTLREKSCAIVVTRRQSRGRCDQCFS